MAVAKFDTPVSLSECMGGCENQRTDGPLIGSFLDWAACASRCMDKVFPQGAERMSPTAQGAELPTAQTELVTHIFLERMQVMRRLHEQSGDERLRAYESQLKFNGAMARLMVQIQKCENVEESIIEVIAIVDESAAPKGDSKCSDQPGTLNKEEGFWSSLKEKAGNLLSDVGDFLITNQPEICAADAALVGIAVAIATKSAKAGSAAAALTLAACNQ